MAEDTSPMEWTDALVESLLYLRIKKYGGSFKGTRSQAQLAATWTVIWIEFKAKNDVIGLMGYMCVALLPKDLAELFLEKGHQQQQGLL